MTGTRVSSARARMLAIAECRDSKADSEHSRVHGFELLSLDPYPERKQPAKQKQSVKEKQAKNPKLGESRKQAVNRKKAARRKQEANPEQVKPNCVPLKLTKSKGNVESDFA